VVLEDSHSAHKVCQEMAALESMVSVVVAVVLVRWLQAVLVAGVHQVAAAVFQAVLVALEQQILAAVALALTM
jgi:hypothetical protein